MKFRKKSKYAGDDLKLARLARAMSHPARVAILRQLALNGKCSFNEVSENLPLAESTVSQHMTELKKAGFIKGLSMPPRTYYSINVPEWKTARRYLKEFTKQMAGKNQKQNKT